jgi:hypothetical protein
MPHEVELNHWTHPRLAEDHPMSDRWSILFKGKFILTFGSKGEALVAVLRYGWTITDRAGDIEGRSRD